MLHPIEADSSSMWTAHCRQFLQSATLDNWSRKPFTTESNWRYAYLSVTCDVKNDEWRMYMMTGHLTTPARNFVPDYWRIRHPICRLQCIDFCHHIWKKKFGTPASESERSKCVRVGRIIILGDSDDQIPHLWVWCTRHFQILCARTRRCLCLDDCLSPSRHPAESLRCGWHWCRRRWRWVGCCSVHLIVCHVTCFAISSSFMSASISPMMRTLSAFIAVSLERLVLQSVLTCNIISWLRLM